MWDIGIEKLFPFLSLSVQLERFPFHNWNKSRENGNDNLRVEKCFFPFFFSWLLMLLFWRKFFFISFFPVHLSSPLFSISSTVAVFHVLTTNEFSSFSSVYSHVNFFLEIPIAIHGNENEKEKEKNWKQQYIKNCWWRNNLIYSLNNLTKWSSFVLFFSNIYFILFYL